MPELTANTGFFTGASKIKKKCKQKKQYKKNMEDKKVTEVL